MAWHTKNNVAGGESSCHTLSFHLETDMKINGSRMLTELKELREMTDTRGEGVTRFSYSAMDMKARAYFQTKAEEADLDYRTDAVGNVYIWDRTHEDDSANAKDARKQKIMIGSHMDTVQNGGWLDGAYGTVAAFEVLRTLKENDILKDNIQLVIFAEEEGSNFTSTTTGSKFVTGVYNAEDLENLKTPKGMSMAEMLEDCDFPPYKKNEVIWDYNTIRAMLELHIEQGPVLDEEGRNIGIVEKVNGMEVLEFTFEGLGNHAGASPMPYRRDALAAAAICISRIEEIAKNEKSGQAVATVGRINVEPNASNVIPGRVVFTVEVRHTDKAVIDGIIGKISALVMETARARNISCDCKKLAESLPVSFDDSLIASIERAAQKSGLDYKRMNSGAVHDASMVGLHVPAAMIFVPSIDGRSHVASENTKEEDLLTGTQLLLDTLLELQA